MPAGPLVPGMSLAVLLAPPSKLRDIVLSSSTFNLRECRRIEERQKALARGIALETEQRGLRKESQYRWFLNRYNPVAG